ncbi:MAG: cytochrome c(L), periplasmic [Methylococcaceae bacterium]|nr:cytochrome c(L), periplasmic [Methylococcaceae bacterium]
MADITFTHTIEGVPLDLSVAKQVDPSKLFDPKAFEAFKQTGSNPYNCNNQAIEAGHNLFLSACSGCHGHEAEGKIGPGLADDYWTYPQNATDKGLFETLFGGAQGMMGPQYVNLGADDMLLIMAWVRSVYQGKPDQAKWLKHKDSVCPDNTLKNRKPQASH